MSNSPTDEPMDLSAVRTALREVLPSRQLTEIPLDNGNHPLLILQTPQVIAGFGLSSNRSDPSTNYRILYEGFKKKYYEHQEDWDDLDPAFVFCVSPDVPGLDRFGTEVETDVYFCRKFVVPLTHPLKKVLAHLPFLPLTSVAGGSLRPLSAQKILRHSGISSRLAEHLVVQGRSGPSTIINACIGGAYGEPKPISNVDTELVSVEGSVTTPLRIRSVTIKSFRAYLTEKTFDLGNKVTILYGPNGFGKTSLFDAIDFATTGGIGRLGSKANSRFEKVATHLDSSPSNSRVSLSLTKNGAAHEIIRTTSDRMHAQLNGKETDRKSILSFLTEGRSDHIENFVRLFRSTHLFSQEQPELAKGFQDDCTLPIDVVSRILSFEDYSNARSKIGDIEKILDRKICDKTSMIASLESQLVRDQTEFKGLESIAQHKDRAIELNNLIESLAQRVSDFGVKVLSDSPDAKTLASWRSILGAQSETERAKISRWSDFVRDAVEMPKKRAEIAEVENRISEKRESLDKLAFELESSRVAHARAEQEVAESSQIRSRLESRIQSLSWLGETVPLYLDLLSKKENALKLVRELSNAAEGLREVETNARQEFRKHEAQIGKFLIELDSRRKRLADIRGALEACDGWISQRTRLPRISKELQSRTEVVKQLASDVREATDRLDDFVRRDEDLTRRVQASDQAQSELERLVSQVERRLQTGICPVCGQDHGSLEELRDRIGARVKPESGSAERSELSRVRVARQKELDHLATLELRQKTVERELKTLRDTRGQLLSDVQAFERKAEQLGVNPSSPAVRERLVEMSDALLQDVARLEEQQSQERKAAAATTDAIDEAKRAAESKRTEAGTQDRLAIELQAKIDRLIDDPRLGQESIELSLTEISERIRASRQELPAVTNAVAAASRDLEVQEKAVERLGREVSRSRTDLVQLRKRAEPLVASIRDISAKFRNAGLPGDISEEGLRLRIARLEGQKARIDELRTEVTEAELAVDEAATRAAFTRLREHIGEQKQAITEAQASRRQLCAWQEYFKTASGILSKHQGLAVSHFAKNYGPQASVIQRRLRSVPGFEDIEVTSAESAIRVRARRQNDQLRPTDYFSQSQQQTLLLGLFLSACLSQSWSSFSPILLDDPVTHCDDLNAYAFLDLLSGLTESELTKRQVVISTCDDRFLQLARRKFRHLGADAKYYMFTAIGDDGPVVLPVD